MTTKLLRMSVVALISLALLPFVGCRKKGTGAAAPAGGDSPAAARPSGGDVLALLTPPGPLTEDLVQRLAALRIDHIWILAGEIGESTTEGAEVTLRYRLPLGVFTILRPAFTSGLTPESAPERASRVAALLTRAAGKINDRGNTVDTAAVVFTGREVDPAAMKAFLGALRKEVSPKIARLVACPPPSFYALPKAAEALAEVDAVIPLVLGSPLPSVGETLGKVPSPVTAATAEALGRPYLAGFWLAAGGALLDSGEAVTKTFPESALDRFSELQDADISLGGTFDEEVGYTYRITPRKDAQVGGVTVPGGSQTRFRGVTPVELVQSLGELSRGQFAHFAGRVYFATDFPQNDGSLGVEALEDAVAGKPIGPEPAVYVDTVDASTVAVTLRNLGRFGTSLSQMNNWIDISVPKGSMGGIEPGRFDRWDIWAGEGAAAQRTMPRRGDRLRLYEFLLGPYEKVGSALIRFTGKVNPGSLRVTVHLLGADGHEISIGPVPAEPTPQEPEEGAAPPDSSAQAPH